ncbi:TonB-dependent receptor plug domain-containing protein [Bowmanella denitrificans]|uniref:TonB-dependent receptor plug domain-containing protein n=1 Tax=Bowmanella denitrificans TaxID=366582 RepID=UPI000C9A8222|nr:TonB-dependent receptor [Bowmanella denitrificans]
MTLRLTALCLFCTSSFAQAAQDHSTAHLFELSLDQLLSMEVSVAARKEESWLSAAGTVYVIDKDEIARFGWRDMKEILAAIPNMDTFYQWSWLAGGQRGFTGNMSSTLLLIDGREVQNLLANEAFMMNNFPAHRIERVEVLQGPNSTLYGGNAAQGVINIITRLPSLHQKTQGDPDRFFEIGGLIGEVDTQQANLLFSGGQNAWRYGLSASWFNSDLDYREISDFVFDDQRFSRSPELDNIRDHGSRGYRNNEHNFTVDARLAYQQYYLGMDMTRTFNVSGIERVAYDFVTGDDSWRGYNLLFAGRNFQPDEHWQGFMEVSLFREYKEKAKQQGRVPDDAQSFDDIEVFAEREDIGPSYRYRFRTQFSYQSTPDQDWIIGYDGWRTDIGHKIRDVDNAGQITPIIPAGWPVDKEKSDKHALYGQYARRWELTQGAMLNLTAGLRYNKQDFTDDAWLPRISLVYQPDQGSAWKLTYGEAFRPPTIFEFDGVQDNSLDSQTVDMYELNYSQGWQWQGMELTNVVALYSMTIKNFYQQIFDTDRRLWRTEVDGKQEARGVENLLRFSGGQWQGFLGFRYVSADDPQLDGQDHLVNVPRTKVKLGVTYHQDEHWQLSAFVDHWASTLTEANRLDGAGTTLEKIPAWTTLNLHLRFADWPLSTGQRLNIGLYAENLLDKTYYHGNPRGTAPYQFIQAPRNLRLQFSVLF